MLKRLWCVGRKTQQRRDTVGVTLAKTEEELKGSGIENCWKAYKNENKALVEQYIPAEIAVPVWEKENGEVIALHGRYQTSRRFYDYKNKYTSGCTEYICPCAGT